MRLFFVHSAPFTFPVSVTAVACTLLLSTNLFLLLDKTQRYTSTETETREITTHENPYRFRNAGSAFCGSNSDGGGSGRKLGCGCSVKPTNLVIVPVKPLVERCRRGGRDAKPSTHANNTTSTTIRPCILAIRRQFVSDLWALKKVPRVRECAGSWTQCPKLVKSFFFIADFLRCKCRSDTKYTAMESRHLGLSEKCHVRIQVLQKVAKQLLNSLNFRLASGSKALLTFDG
jgi:hypothetical protein